MKYLTEGHMLQNSPKFTEERITEIFQGLDDEKPMQRIAKVKILRIYYWILQQEEVLTIVVKDVRVVDKGEVVVEYSYSTKIHDKGCSFYIPKKTCTIIFWVYWTIIHQKGTYL